MYVNLYIQSSWYGRTPLVPGKSLGDLRKFRPIFVRLDAFFQKWISPEGRSKELPKMGCMSGVYGFRFIYIYIYFSY